MLGLELILECNLALMYLTEFVDFVLIFLADFNLIPTGCGLVFFGKL
jgi:hypothetical protein